MLRNMPQPGRSGPRPRPRSCFQYSRSAVTTWLLLMGLCLASAGGLESPSMPDERKPARKRPAASAALDASWPENIRRGLEIARREIPDLGAIQPYGWLSRMALPNANAYVSPGRTIYLNPQTMAGMSPEEVADTLTHEQTHVRQANQRGNGAFMEALRLAMGPSGPYGQRPDEMAAWQAEQQRRAAMGRMQTARPAFGGGYYVPADVNLPREKKR